MLDLATLASQKGLRERGKRGPCWVSCVSRVARASRVDLEYKPLRVQSEWGMKFRQQQQQQQEQWYNNKQPSFQHVVELRRIRNSATLTLVPSGPFMLGLPNQCGTDGSALAEA